MDRTALNAAVLAAGVALVATPVPAFARESRANAIRCPEVPPPFNESSGRSGGLAANIPPFSANLTGTRERARNDVIIQTQGMDDYFDTMHYATFCDAVRKLYPGNVARQLAEVERWLARRRSQRMSQSVASAPIIDILAREPSPPPSEAVREQPFAEWGVRLDLTPAQN